VLALTTIFLIFVFLSTSAASGAFVLGMMTSAGALDPPRSRKLFWGAVIAVLTAAILLAGGEVHVLRAIAISGALPFAAIMIVHIACLFHSLAKAKTLPRPELEEEPEPRTATGQEASR
jgi:glycine betaine transporter